jgi:hypothetical protein
MRHDGISTHEATSNFGGTDKPMKIKLCFLMLTVTLIAGVSESFAQDERLDVGTKLLIPSSARTDRFTSLLVVLNLDDETNEVTITARRTDGSTIGTPLNITIPQGGRYRNTDILGAMGAALGEFGPITVESTNDQVLSAVSEVSSAQGLAGFFPGINVDTAWELGFIAEVVDTGDRGTPGTHRTNLGVNTVGDSGTNVIITFHDNNGALLGSTSVFVPGNGMAQLNNVIRAALGSAAVTGREGYLRLASDEPIIAWASKIENGFDDPGFQIGIGAAD